jgi:hypothetical protein
VRIRELFPPDPAGVFAETLLRVADEVASAKAARAGASGVSGAAGVMKGDGDVR